MKKIFQLCSFLFAMGFFSACSDNDKGLVVSQDTSYQLDEDYVFVDIPEQFTFDDSNILYLDGKALIKLTGSASDEGTTIKGGTTFKFKVKLKRALDRTLVVNFKKDESLLDNLPDAKKLLPFPEECYQISEAVIPAGHTEVEVTLELVNVDLLVESGYVLPIRIETAETVEGLHNSVQWYSFVVQLELEKAKNNISDNTGEVVGTRFNQYIVFESDKTDGLYKLNDGKEWGQWYPNKDSYLLMTLPDVEVIKGITFLTQTGSWSTLGQFKLYVKEESGSYYYGEVKRKQTDGYLHINFKQPVPVKSVRLEEIRDTDGGASPDIKEIWFVK